jgi:hypothetical protein
MNWRRCGIARPSVAPALNGLSCTFRQIRLRLAYFLLATGKIRHEPLLFPIEAVKRLFSGWSDPSGLAMRLFDRFLIFTKLPAAR